MMDLVKAGLQLARAAETTARAVMPYSGKGDKHLADQVAVETMRSELNKLDMRMKVIIGEGEKDQAPMLFNGERLGRLADDESADCLELISDPLECTTNFAKGLPDSMSVLVAAPASSVQEVPGTYMEQLLVPPEAASLLKDEINLDTPVKRMLELTSRALGRSLADMTVVVQDRPRHQDLIREIREAGAGVSLIESGSISAALEIMSGKERRLVIMKGIFGAPEGLIVAFMAGRRGAGFLGRIKPHNESTARFAEKLGIMDRTLTANEWIRKDGVLVMSGIHSSPALPGVEYLSNGSSMRVHTMIWSGERKLQTVHVDGVLGETREL